ncbi:Pimeloyl-ACP methyl ester carboxylesterase [Kibdelosporangium sp. 4NS15]|uniref:Pimeloyl-ACP methyl ester carboxylesterase n=1 Tax=Kibdelosporangium persicum TaxID=2698649 RepID=A0ABX2FC96_9PSEU|nr:alpha/beta hydrolase [Kibdelosporangium persicum]NRN68759.1 Pimeloyl-ACP methyl ester carboxylesterase [Kibdelosporangium persicum]
MTLRQHELPGAETTARPDWLPIAFEVHRISTNGTRIAAAVGGTGPPMVLLHGWPQTSRAWRRVMPALAQRHTVVVPDLRGAGASDRPAGGYAKTNQADDMRGVLAELGLTGPAVVVGHDIGAMVAFAWAASHPGDVSALVLLDALIPGLGLEEAMNVAEGGMWHFGFFMAPEIPEMLFDGHELEFVSATFGALSTPGTFTDDDLAYYAKAYQGKDRLRGGFEQYRTLLEDGTANRALLAGRDGLPMPVLVVAAGRHVGDVDVAAPLRPYVPHVSGVAAPSGHFIAEEVPDWFVGTLERFLAPAGS